MTVSTIDRPKEVSGIKQPAEFTTPKGLKFTAVKHGSSLTLFSRDDPNENITVTGPETIDFSVGGAIGSVLDGLVDVLKAVKGLLSCTPTTKTTVNVGANGQITSVVTEASCVPN